MSDLKLTLEKYVTKLFFVQKREIKPERLTTDINLLS